MLSLAFLVFFMQAGFGFAGAGYLMKHKDVEYLKRAGTSLFDLCCVESIMSCRSEDDLHPVNHFGRQKTETYILEIL
jgi:hypothetical protein